MTRVNDAVRQVEFQRNGSAVACCQMLRVDNRLSNLFNHGKLNFVSSYAQQQRDHYPDKNLMHAQIQGNFSLIAGKYSPRRHEEHEENKKLRALRGGVFLLGLPVINEMLRCAYLFHRFLM